MIRKTLIAAAALALAGTAAAADCREELDALSGGGVAKDGTTAPLADSAGATPQTGGGTAAPAEPSSEGIVKEGGMAPLGADPDIATSGQDVAAQQAGGETAAAQATGAEGGGDPRAQAISRAEAALAAGDEAACLEAVREAQGH
jgi:hypothetical protein